jgi:hypothetical protein
VLGSTLLWLGGWLLHFATSVRSRTTRRGIRRRGRGARLNRVCCWLASLFFVPTMVMALGGERRARIPRRLFIFDSLHPFHSPPSWGLSGYPVVECPLGETGYRGHLLEIDCPVHPDAQSNTFWNHPCRVLTILLVFDLEFTFTHCFLLFSGGWKKEGVGKSYGLSNFRRRRLLELLFR